MSLVLDAGALVALERGDVQVVRHLKGAHTEGHTPLTHGGVIAQVWRGGDHRQVLLARALAGVEVLPLDDDLGRKAGMLLARSGTTDAIDAAVVAMANDGDQILTSDPIDIGMLAELSGLHLMIVPT
jgi:hypothetical protein